MKWCLTPDFEKVCEGACIPAEPLKKSIALLLNSDEAIIKYHCARLEKELMNLTD